MIETKSSLTVFYNTTNVSQKVACFGRDTVEIDMTVVDYIYFGFKKPINSVYFNLLSDYESETELRLECFTGSWVDLIHNDDTLGLFRSGFIRWTNNSNQIQSEYEGFNRFWYRLGVGRNRDALKISGINLVFSDDYDLMLENPVITSQEFLGSSKSHILYHSATRNEILQNLRAVKTNNEDLNQWDLFYIEEVRNASVMGTLSKIYYNMSDNDQDVWYLKSKDYENKFVSLLQKIQASFDVNDDGIEQEDEVKVLSSGCFFMTR